MIEIKNLTKKYGAGAGSQLALDNVSVSIPEKEFTAITGKSGSGKTTLLNMLGLIDKPDSGEILINEKNILAFSRKEKLKFHRTTMGMVFQFFYLIPSLSCKENILIANEFAPHYRKEYFDDLAEQLDIVDILRKYPDQLSGGQKQRIAIARALINKPKLLLADEPTGNLDSENSGRVMEMLKTLSKEHGITLIVVTHDEDIAAEADYRIYLSDGQAEVLRG